MTARSEAASIAARYVTLDDLRNPPRNRFEILKGDRSVQISIRINDQWRICFAWSDSEVHDVQIVVYH